MNIGLGTLQDQFELSGEFQAFRGWGERLVESGASVRFFSPQGESLRSSPLIRVEGGEYLFKQFIEQWTFIRHAARIARSVDVLHLFLPTPNFLWIADRIKEKSGLPTVVTCLGEKPGIEAARLAGLLRQSIRFHGVRYLADKLLPVGRFRCDRYIAGNAHVARQLQDAGCPERKIIVQTPILPAEAAVDDYSRGLAEGLAGHPTFIYLGHFLPNKGVDLLLDAFAEIERDARLLLVWSGLGSLSAVQHRLRKLGLRKRVELVERVVHRSTVLAKACAVVLPFRVSFGQVSPPITLLEAFRCGVPVIMTRSPAVAEFGGDGMNVLQIDANDRTALTEKMRWIVDHPEPAREMRRLQREFWARKTSAVDMKELYGSLFHG